MKTISPFRLEKSGWKLSIATNVHRLYYKKNWSCAISFYTGQVSFSRVMKTDTVELMRGPVEEGIE